MVDDAIARAKEIAARFSSGAGAPTPSPVPTDETAAPTTTRLGKRKNRWGQTSQPALEAAQAFPWSNGAPKQARQDRETVKIYIPESAPPNIMGLLIGPRGSNQKRMEEESGAKIYIRGKGSQKGPARGDGHPDDEDELHVAIDAFSTESLEKAKKMVEEILFDPEKARQIKSDQLRQMGVESDRGGLGLGGDHRSGDGSITKEIIVPSTIVGLLIGKGGEHIRDLQTRTGASVQIAKDNIPGKMERLVTVSGSEEQVKQASAAIDGVIDDRHGGRTRIPENGLKVPVPNDKVGLIIGKQGMTIKAIQSKTGAQIQIPPDPDPEDRNTRSLVVIGGKAEREAAEEQIYQILCENEMQFKNNRDMQQPNPGSQVVYAKVPNGQVGLIIGKQGSTIKEIQNKTGTRIQIPPEPDPDSDPKNPMRTITITGMGDGPQNAQYEINMLLQGDPRQQGGPGAYGHQAPYGAYGAAAYGAYGQPGYGAYPQAGYGYYDPNQQYAAGPAEGGVDPNQQQYSQEDYYKAFHEYAAAYGEEYARAAYGAYAPPPGHKPGDPVPTSTPQEGGGKVEPNTPAKEPPGTSNGDNPDNGDGPPGS